MESDKTEQKIYIHNIVTVMIHIVNTNIIYSPILNWTTPIDRDFGTK